MKCPKCGMRAQYDDYCFHCGTWLHCGEQEEDCDHEPYNDEYDKEVERLGGPGGE